MPKLPTGDKQYNKILGTPHDKFIATFFVGMSKA
jgi:hypothetical protein